jgi:hypothetical protein
MATGRDYDSMISAIDTEGHKHLAFPVLKGTGVFIAVNTVLAGAIVKDSCMKSVIIEIRFGCNAVVAKAFVDLTGYSELSVHTKTKHTVPND